MFAVRPLAIAGLLFATPVASAAPIQPPDVTGVLSALHQYEAAYEALDVFQVADVLPSLVRSDIERIRRSFAGMLAYELEVRNARVEVQSDVAIVHALVARRMVPRVGRPVTNETETRFWLRRTDGKWVIGALPAPVAGDPSSSASRR